MMILLNADDFDLVGDAYRRVQNTTVLGVKLKPEVRPMVRVKSEFEYSFEIMIEMHNFNTDEVSTIVLQDMCDTMHFTKVAIPLSEALSDALSDNRDYLWPYVQYTLGNQGALTIVHSQEGYSIVDKLRESGRIDSYSVPDGFDIGLYFQFGNYLSAGFGNLREMTEYLEIIPVDELEI